MYAHNDNAGPTARDSRGTAIGTLLHQMRPWPLMWRRPMDDRPPYAVWVIGGLVVWAFILAGFMAWDLHSTSRNTVWAMFAGWCIGVLGAGAAVIAAVTGLTVPTVTRMMRPEVLRVE